MNVLGADERANSLDRQIPKWENDVVRGKEQVLQEGGQG